MSDGDLVNGTEPAGDEMRLRRALWIVPVADLGGVARHVLDVARVGIPGWQLTVLCPVGPLADRLRAQGSAVTAGAFGTEAGALTSRRTLAAVAKALRPDVVHSHLAFADIVNAWTSLPEGTRRFTTEHGIAGDDGVYHASGLQSRAMALVHRARFPRFDGVIAVAEATRRVMIEKWHVTQRIAVIHNGVDLPTGVERRDPSSVSGLRVLSLSRLAPEKRIDKLIEAFALILRDHPDATLTIAGEGPLRAELENHAMGLGVLGSTYFAGYVDADEAMGNADILTQLSIWENCSYTLLDAAARELRILASDVGGNREIVGEASVVDRESSANVVARRLVTTVPRRSPKLISVGDMCEHLVKEYEREMHDD